MLQKISDQVLKHSQSPPQAAGINHRVSYRTINIFISTFYGLLNTIQSFPFADKENKFGFNTVFLTVKREGMIKDPDRQGARKTWATRENCPSKDIIFSPEQGVLSGQPFWTSSGLLFRVTPWVRGRRPSVAFTSCLINFSFVPSSFAREKETRWVLLKKQGKKKNPTKLKSFSFLQDRR